MALVWALFLMKWGKKLELAQLVTPSHWREWAPRRSSITEFGFPWDMCEAAISANWIRDVPIYLRAEPLHVEFFKPHQLNSYLSCYRSDYFILIFPFVLRKHRAAAHWS